MDFFQKIPPVIFFIQFNSLNVASHTYAGTSLYQILTKGDYKMFERRKNIKTAKSMKKKRKNLNKILMKEIKSMDDENIERLIQYAQSLMTSQF